MRNMIFDSGRQLGDVPVPDGTLAGAPVRVGAFATGLNGVTLTKEGEGGNADNFATVAFDGVAEFITGIAITNWGDPVYITSANALSASASSNQLYGHALNTKAGTSGKLRVRIAN